MLVRSLRRVANLIRKLLWRMRLLNPRRQSRSILKIDGQTLRFQTSTYSSWVRAKSGHLKEPLTRRWIESMVPGSCFWDVGSNVGVFTLMAAKRGLRVVSIEPLVSNLAEMSQSIALNAGLEEITLQVLAGLDAETGVSPFNLAGEKAGQSGGQIGLAINDRGLRFTPHSVRPSLKLRGDDLVDLLPTEWGNFRYLKIDVDGNELNCLEGLRGTLARGSAESLLIEVQSVGRATRTEIEEFMGPLGYSVIDSEITLEKKDLLVENLLFRLSKS